MDKMSEYILFSDKDLDDTTKDKNGQTAKDRKVTYTFSQESNLKSIQVKNEISYDQYIYLINNTDNLEKINYDDQNHATYTLKDFESRINECPYVMDYYEFNKNVRKIIEKLDKQLQKYEELKEDYNKMGMEYEIPLLVYKNKKGKEYHFTPKHLTAIKRGIGYSKNNSKEIDQDIIAIYREWFKPIYFQSVTRTNEYRRELDLDFMDREHISGLIKASCLTGQFSKFDDYVNKLDKLVEKTNLTELEKQIYSVFRKGKGLDLDKNRYEENMVTISECARILGRNQSKVNDTFNSLVDKIVDKYEEVFEDYYFTYIARGTYKTCSKCGEVKLANERYFSPDKRNKDGLDGRCKLCERERKSN